MCNFVWTPIKPKWPLFSKVNFSQTRAFSNQKKESFGLHIKFLSVLLLQDIESVETNETDTFPIASSSSEEEIKGSQEGSQESSDAQAPGRY